MFVPLFHWPLQKLLRKKTQKDIIGGEGNPEASEQDVPGRARVRAPRLLAQTSLSEER